VLQNTDATKGIAITRDYVGFPARRQRPAAAPYLPPTSASE